jgi:hypothetical protein
MVFRADLATDRWVKTMSSGTLRRYATVWRFSEPPDQLWPVLGDTARLNEAAGLPKYTLVETPRVDGSVERIGAAKIGRYQLEWEELPAEWVAPVTFRQERRCRRGPLGRFICSFTAEPDGGGTIVRYVWEADAAN